MNLLQTRDTRCWPSEFNFFKDTCTPCLILQYYVGSKVQGKPAPWPEKVLWSEWACPTAVRSAHIPYRPSPRQWHQYMQHLSLTLLFTSRILNLKQNMCHPTDWYWYHWQLVQVTGFSRRHAMLRAIRKIWWTHSRPFSRSAASNPSPMLTKSRSRNCGLKLAPLNGTHPLTLAVILENFGRRIQSRNDRSRGNTIGSGSI